MADDDKINLNQDLFLSIYGTNTNLQEYCNSSKECWNGKESLKTTYSQVPYFPYFGQMYDGLLFAGINLNGGNESFTAIDELVEIAIYDYLKHGKYKIFKSDHYGGSPFYYYVPLISYLYHEYLAGKSFIKNEDDISFEQIICGYQYCGLTNVIKCSTKSDDRRSKPTNAMFSNCSKKFINEVSKIRCHTLICFSFFLWPSFSENFGPFENIVSRDRYRILQNKRINILELEHPLSTKMNRESKFNNYSEGVFELVHLTQSI
jgi:hypothetical protein